MADTYADALSRLQTTGEVTLPGRAARMWLLALVSLLLAGVGAGLAIGSLSDLPFGPSPHDNLFTVILGALVALFFAPLGLWVLPVRALRQRRALTIDRDGLRIEDGPVIDWAWIDGAAPGPRGAAATLLLDRAQLRAWSRDLPAALRWAQRLHHRVVHVPPLAGVEPQETVALIVAGGHQHA